MAQRLVLFLAARGRNLGRRAASVDITKAFLQGVEYEAEDMVIVRPPPDLRRPRHLLRCRKSVYGLKDAPRKWYLALRSFLLKLGGRELASGERCVIVFGDSDFINQNGNLMQPEFSQTESVTGDAWAAHGNPRSWPQEEELENIWLVISLHVDDLLCSGDTDCLEWIRECLDQQFGVGSIRYDSFPHCGCAIETVADGFVIHQNEYVEQNTQPIIIDASRGPDDVMTPTEMTQYRSLTAGLAWSTTMTRADGAFSVSARRESEIQRSAY